MIKNMSILLVTTSIGCAPSLEKEWDWNDEPLETEEIEEEEIEEGVYTNVIDATDAENWIYLDLESNELVAVDDPMDSTDWDIGFRRSHLKLNSGMHGLSTVEAALIEDAAYVPYDEAPAEGYQQDLPDTNGDGNPEYALGEWYDYDPSTHILTPKNQFYVVRSRNDVFFKFRILDYYDSAGTSGYLNIGWEEIDSPSNPVPSNPDIDKTINATDASTWIYFDLESASIVSPEDPTDSTDWDIAFQRYQIAINGGISGTGEMEVLPVLGVYDDFETLDEAPEGEWVTDVEDADDDGIPEYAFQDWFDYDVSTHILTPANAVYFVRTVEENTFRVRIHDYYSAQGDSGYMSVEFDEL
ncbi:MAG: HmuY family protein [Myxococcota bacterium]|nr:HmuY family protein [Myxococcota bacterium]